ncbi:MAG: hypothetical protein R2815_04780 [Flavobacteriales bacterium]
MKKARRLLRPIGAVLATAAVLVALGFVERNVDRTPVSALKITVKGGEGVHFVDEAMVRRNVLDQGTSVMGVPLGDLDVPGIEERLRNDPSVASAEVYHTMDGVLHVSVVQREPVVRVFNQDGTSFYIDSEGWTMPTSAHYTARVLVVTGALNEPGVRDGVHSVYGPDSMQQVLLSDDIHRLAMHIRQDPLWNALIDQVVVDPYGDLELIPKVGAQRIMLGDGTELAPRFEKLRLFYRKGIPQADWRRYARIDLRFADQVVCTKRTTP